MKEAPPSPWVEVPTISRFHGIAIQMYYRDHTPPHFHVRASGREAQVQINPVKVINGKLDRNQFTLIKKWASLHRKELEDNWLLARDRATLKQIEPWR